MTFTNVSTTLCCVFEVITFYIEPWMEPRRITFTRLLMTTDNLALVTN